MIERHGFFWPDDDRDGHAVIPFECEPAITHLMPYISGRDCIVQAGANVGVYPVRLSALFGEVVTVEPDRANFGCLMANLGDTTGINIDARFAAFGEEPGDCRIVEVRPGNCGAHRIEPGGSIPVLTIDSLGLDPDCIWLDIEGYELHALKGARATIERCGPVICVEEKGLAASYGERPEDLAAWLSQFGYTRRARIGRDNVYSPV